jgi:hypothetical protein
MDQVKRTQERSHEVELHINKITEKSKEKIQSLEDIIHLINSYAHPTLSFIMHLP